MKENDNMISIITPTYNRAYILPQLYESLNNQSIHDFEWIIVDDGSIDNTEDIVKKWIVDYRKNFDIRYVKTKNGGKHRALNKGIPLAKYDYIYMIDSDDYMLEDAVKSIDLWISTIVDKDEFAGVSGLRGKNHNAEINILGEFPSKLKFIDATNLERRKRKLLGDKAEVYRKDILLKYTFPEFEGENFLSEGIVWNKIAAEGYKIRWFNKIICVCEYLEDGLSKNAFKLIDSNFNGYTHYEKMNIKLDSFLYSKIAIGRYLKFAYKKGMNDQEIMNILEISKFDLYQGRVIGYIKEVFKILINKTII